MQRPLHASSHARSPAGAFVRRAVARSDSVTHRVTHRVTVFIHAGVQGCASATSDGAGQPATSPAPRRTVSSVRVRQSPVVLKSQIEFIKSFCNKTFPQESVNLLIIYQ